MNLVLFANQLNQLLQAPSKPDIIGCLEGVCDLLRIHTDSSVRLTNHNGDAVVELLNLQKTIFSQAVYSVSALIIAEGKDFGSLFLCKNDKPFNETETLAMNFASSICTILMQYQHKQDAADKKRRIKSVRAVINNLSFSELEAATHAVRAIDGSEGLLVGGHIADRLGFTRSVVTGALKKLEGAGLIETRSLGMKGTYIRIIDLLLKDELGKL